MTFHNAFHAYFDASKKNPKLGLPLAELREEYYIPALEQALSVQKAAIEKIKGEKNPNFSNCIEVLEDVSLPISIVDLTFWNIQHANTNPEIEKLSKKFSEITTNAQNDMLLDQALFLQIEKVYKNAHTENLTNEQKRVLDIYYKNFTRNGALLNEQDKKILREINQRLSELAILFSQNVLKETNDYFLHIKNESDCAGLSQAFKEMAKAAAKERNLEGYVITLHIPSYLPFMKYADNAALRKELSIAFGRRAHQANAHNNDSVVYEITSLKRKRAQLLGYENHCAFVLEERMAQNEEKVFELLNALYEKSKTPVLKELEELKKFKYDLSGEKEFFSWDYYYYAEKLKLKKFNLSDEALKPYFQLEKVIQGVFLVAQKLYGLEFKKNPLIQTYHPEMDAYEVYDSSTGNFVSLFYTDFFPRAGKRSGAWMTYFQPQYRFNGREARPHVSIVCNFSKPTATTPSLLSLMEVTTLFHEFGHALHGMLAQTHYPLLSGTNVYWDFVELPSQIMENWVYEKETLDLFAKHYQTGASLPEELIEKIKELKKFHQGYATFRQLAFAFIDMKWHGSTVSESTIEALEKNTLEKVALFPVEPGTAISTSFSHIFDGGYSSGYYSYKWAEVLEADAFELFLEKGIFNPEVSQKFKDTVLSKGGTEHPMNLYRKFRGHEPKTDALLKRAGLI